jgi:hypothetical protein
MAFGEPLLCFDFILRHDVCQLQQIYAGAVLLARYSMHPEPYQSVSEGANCIASPAKWFPCMYAIDPDTFAGYCIVSLPLPGALHNFTCSSILHMMLSTCSVMLLCDLCFAAAGWVQMTCHGHGYTCSRSGHHLQAVQCFKMYLVMNPVPLSVTDTTAENCISSIAEDYGHQWTATGMLV